MCILFQVITLEGNQFTLLDNESTCNNVTYKCTVKSTLPNGATLWNGTAFNCPDEGYNILLFHSISKESSGYKSPERRCNTSNGAFVGWIDRVENDSYISLLTVSLSSEIIGRNIKCFHDYQNGSVKIIGQSLLGGIIIIILQ